MDRLRVYATGRRLEGLNQLVAHLATLTRALAEHRSLLAISTLVDRARRDFELSIDALLSGHYGVVKDLMRDILEIEMLFSDFTHRPDQQERWLAIDPRTRWREFKPLSLRKREAQRRGIRLADLPDREDYHFHSFLLHLNPMPAWLTETTRGIARDTNFFEVDLLLPKYFITHASSSLGSKSSFKSCRPT